MIALGREAVTLYHRERSEGEGGRSQDLWTRHVLRGCLWRDSTAQRMDGNAALGATQGVCRIPVGQMKPQKGDVLILGEIPDSADTAKAVGLLLEKHREDGAFRVTSVAHNGRVGMPLPHYAARGE